MSNPGQITQLLRELSEAQEPEALRRLMPLVYDELKVLARSHRYRWPDWQGPGTTSLVHEAYVRLSRLERPDFQGRKQFFGLASRAMRSILIDNARRRKRQKRGGKTPDLPADQVVLVSEDRCDELLDLDRALGRLEQARPELVRVFECRCFGGLSIAETADALGISQATVKRRWAVVTALLYTPAGEAGEFTESL